MKEKKTFFKLPVDLGRNLNTHSIVVNIEDNKVLLRTFEEIFNWGGNEIYDKNIGTTTKDNLKQFCREIIKNLD